MDSKKDRFNKFQQIYLQLIDDCVQSGKQKPEFHFNYIGQTLVLSLNEVDPPILQMKELQMALSLLETIDLRGLGFLRIQIDISNFKGELNAQEIRDIHCSLSTLRNIEIKISESNNEQFLNGILQRDFNAYSLLTFLSYECPHTKQSYEYFLQGERAILRMNSSQEHEYYLKTNLYMILSTKSEESYELPLLRFYEIAKSILPQIISIKSLEKPVSSKPQIYKKICLLAVNSQVISQSEAFRKLGSILNFIELEQSRISKLLLKVLSDKGLLEIAEPMSTITESKLVLNQLKQLKIAAKTQYNFDQIHTVGQISLLLELTKCVKSIKVYFQIKISTLSTHLYKMLESLGETIKNGGCTQFEKLNIRTRDLEQFDYSLQLAEILPCLKTFKIKIDGSYENPIEFLKKYLQRSISLINKLDIFYLHFLFRYYHKTLLIIVRQMNLQTYKVLFDMIPPAINQLEKAINLEIIFEGLEEQLNRYLVYNFYKELLNLSGINQIAFCDSQLDSELNSISQSRQSFYNSITAYYSLVSPLMQYNPHAILLDLFDV